MEIIADLHLHSKYSRAVSGRMTVPQIAEWGRKKGIGLLATADWTHPLWLKELRANLVEAGEGIYKSKTQNSPYFLLSTEISSIYSQGGKLRKIHNLVFAPSFETVEKINVELLRKGCHLMADGRPIIGLSARDLVELVLGIDDDCLVISAHAWTPWFSLFGSRSGFDSLEECYQDMSKYIYAIETGLSSSPDMNWRIEELDKRSIVSFSDAHSPEKLGREATIFKIKNQKSKIKNFNYLDIKKAIEEQKIASTIEFYPQVGKYHCTGHRNCGVIQSPEETKKLGATCSVCGRRLTVGVMQRVEDLAARPADYQPENRPPYKMLVPLMEIVAESFQIGVSSQTVNVEYNKLIKNFGSEFAVLLKTKIAEIAKIAGERVAEGIRRTREGNLVIEPGYDGVFGKVRIWSHSAEAPWDEQKQMSLF